MREPDDDCDDGRENLAQTLAREMKKPETIGEDDDRIELALPPGWKHQTIDLEKYQPHPRRANTTALLTSKDAFCDYVQRHHDPVATTVWCQQDPVAGKVSFAALFDDHDPIKTNPGWRAHRATFTPQFSVEWDVWSRNNKQPVEQEAFAVFLEANQADIQGGDGFPTGAQMLAMALDFQAKQDTKFKSALRLQSGSVRMEFITDEDKGTVETMSVFERFQIAIPVFRDDTARYPITARLRYRHPNAKLAFWYELIRADKVFQQSSEALVEYVREKCNLPFFFGNPG